MRALLSKVPVYVILNEAAPLMGAAGRAASMAEQIGAGPLTPEIEGRSIDREAIRS